MTGENFIQNKLSSKKYVQHITPIPLFMVHNKLYKFRDNSYILVEKKNVF
jgi:hypothetical protein